MNAPRFPLLGGAVKGNGDMREDGMQERHGSAADDGLFGSFPMSVLFARPANASRLRLGDINGRGLPLIGSGTGNRGVRGRTDKPAEPCPAGTITLDFLGNAYYRAFPYKMTRNHVMSPRGPVIADEMTGIYLECVLSWFSKVFSYDYELTWDRIKDRRIPLPVSVPAGEDREWDGNDIDFDRIHAMIAPKMRACGDRIQRMREWILRTAGTNDDVGGADGAAPFRRSPHADDAGGGGNDDRHQGFADFIIGGMFERIQAGPKGAFDRGGGTSPGRTREFDTPLVGARKGNDGIMLYGCAKDWNAQGMCLDVVQNGASSTGLVYAQPLPVGVLGDAYLIRPTGDTPSEAVLLYLAACVQKIARQCFSYGRKATWPRLRSCTIRLPVTADGGIDHDRMERRIRAVVDRIVRERVDDGRRWMRIMRSSSL